MGVIFVARSARLSQWASDVGLTKHVFKVGYCEQDAKAAISSGWAGETDWTLVKQQEIAESNEAELIRRLQHKEKMIDPFYYPRLRGATGIFKVSPEHVERHIVVSRALAGDPQHTPLKLKSADFAQYLIHNALPAKPNG